MSTDGASQPLSIAIQHDEVVSPDGLFENLNGCDGFMWRFGLTPVPRLVAKRLLQAMEDGQALAVFPDTNTIWHFEDKIAQHYLLSAMGIPQPRTRVLWDHGEALNYRDSGTPCRHPFGEG